MTPLFGKSNDPDERPSVAEMLGAAILAIVCLFAWWIVSILTSPFAP